jgi:myosin heavy subunit
MKKGYIIAGLVSALVVAAALVFLIILPQKSDNEQLEQKVQAVQELAELEKEEMANDYEQLGQQYGEMMSQLTNDSLIAQLTREQMRVHQLEEELKQVKSDDLREIARLRKELNSVRAVLRDYIRQVDSLNQINQSLRNENTQLTGRLEESHRENQNLVQQREQLTEKVTIAAQLDATAINMTALNKRNKASKKMKDAKTLQVSFNISRNVTAENGQRTLYVRIQTPTGDVLNGGGTFAYENRQLEYSMKKVIEYSGEETAVVTYWQVGEFLDAGEYRVSIFADGNMIGSRTFSFEK